MTVCAHLNCVVSVFTTGVRWQLALVHVCYFMWQLALVHVCYVRWQLTLVHLCYVRWQLVLVYLYYVRWQLALVHVCYVRWQLALVHVCYVRSSWNSLRCAPSGGWRCLACHDICFLPWLPHAVTRLLHVTRLPCMELGCRV